MCLTGPVGRRDAAVERTAMYLQRVLEDTSPVCDYSEVRSNHNFSSSTLPLITTCYFAELLANLAGQIIVSWKYLHDDSNSGHLIYILRTVWCR